MLLSATICLAGLTSALAVSEDVYWSVSEYEELTGKKIEKFNEAPELRTLVAAGELPPVEERLPEEPLVVLPRSKDKKIGKYGGVLNVRWPGVEAQSLIGNKHSFTDEIYPYVVESFEMAEGGREWTFRLRKGLKWSDSVPFTTDDVMFCYEDIGLNKEYSPGIPGWLQQASGGHLTFIKIDDYTFKIVSEVPYRLFESQDMRYKPVFYPKHYLKQFHPKYQDKDTLDKIVKEAGVDSWVQVMQNSVSDWLQVNDVDKPVLHPWVIVQGTPEKIWIFKRNPYFFAVDTEGNQLPYIGEMRIETGASIEIQKLRAIAGETDFYAALYQLDLYPLAKEAEKEGKIKVTRWAHSDINTADLEFNLTIEEPVLRKIFRDKRFRFAASYAIDRELMNELLFLGLLEPQQCGWSKASPFYNERLNKTAIEYDPAKANSLLDEMGLSKRDTDGWRLRPDGKRLEINMVLADWWEQDKIAEIIADNLKAVGLFVNLRIIGLSLWQEMRVANKLEATLISHTWWTNEGTQQANALGIPEPGTAYGRLWYDWIASSGERGEKPIPEILEAIEAASKWKASFDPEERKRLMKKITDIAADNLWVIGTLSSGGWVVIFNAKLQNYPTEFFSWTRGDYGLPWMWFFEE